MQTELLPGVLSSAFIVDQSVSEARGSSLYHARRSGFVSRVTVVVMFFVIFHSSGNCFAKRYDYIIELHQAGEREGPTVGKAILTNKEKGLALEGFSTNVEALYLNATFFESNSSFQTPMITEGFYQHSFIDHIWRIKSPGQRRTVVIKQGYISETAPFKKMADVEPATSCCFIKRSHNELMSEHINLPWQKMNFLIEDFPRGISGKMALAENVWEINNTDGLDDNEPACSGESCFDIILIQSLTTLYKRTYRAGRRIKRSHDPHTTRFLTPASYAHLHDPEGASVVPILLENYIFPFDWEPADSDNHPVTDVNLELSDSAIRLYEYIDGAIREKDEPELLQQFIFKTVTGNMDLTVWAQPVDNLPWAWEVREKRPPNRAIRFLRIFVPDRQQNLQPTLIRKSVGVEGADRGRTRYKKLEFLPSVAENQEYQATSSSTVNEVRLYNVMILASLFSVFSQSGCFSGVYPGAGIRFPSTLMR